MTSPFEIYKTVKQALLDCKRFKYVGDYPYDVQKALAQVQNTDPVNFATCIITDVGQNESFDLPLSGYDNIDYNLDVTYFYVKPKGSTIKIAYDYEKVIKDIILNRNIYSESPVCAYFTGSETGNFTNDELSSNNMLGYSAEVVSRKLSFKINIQIERTSGC